MIVNELNDKGDVRLSLDAEEMAELVCVLGFTRAHGGHTDLSERLRMRLRDYVPHHQTDKR